MQLPRDESHRRNYGVTMADDGKTDLARLLRLAGEGGSDAREDFYRLIYDDLRESARRILRKHSRGEFQTTALVNESLMRFEKEGVLKKFSENRRVFFSVANRAMQQVLIDHHRRRKLEKDRFDENSHPFDLSILSIQKQTGFDFEELSNALNELEYENPRQHAVITHRFFGGLTIEQTAQLLGVSEGTVERDWRLARAKLIRRLNG